MPIVIGVVDLYSALATEHYIQKVPFIKCEMKAFHAIGMHMQIEWFASTYQRRCSALTIDELTSDVSGNCLLACQCARA